MKPVVTLSEEGLADALNKIWAKIQQSAEKPDAILGIATGGAICAKVLSGTTGLPYFECSLKRPSTAKKSSSGFTRLLRFLPYLITNNLRRFEDYNLARRNSTHIRPKADKATMRSNYLKAQLNLVISELKALECTRLLILDDAVDSGKTLSTVINYLESLGDSQIKLITAAVVQTRRNASAAPDFVLFYETLCRFPWSYDYRGSRHAGR